MVCRFNCQIIFGKNNNIYFSLIRVMEIFKIYASALSFMNKYITTVTNAFISLFLESSVPEMFWVDRGSDH